MGKTTTIYRRLLTYVIPFWPVLALGITANILYSSIDAGFTYMLKPFMNKGFIDKDVSFVKWIPLMVLIGVSLRGIVNSLGAYCMTWVARCVVKVFRQRVFSHIVHLPAKYYDKSSSGQLLSKILYDVEQIAQVSADALTTLVQSVCLIVGLLIVMFVINWQLSTLFLVTMPFIGIIVSFTNKRIRRVSHQVQQSMGEVTQVAGEAIDSYKVVRVFGGQVYECDKFNRITEKARKRDMKVAMTKAFNVTGVQVVIAIGIAMIVGVSIKLSAIIDVTAGGFLSIIAAMLQLIKPLKNLTTVNSVIQRGLAGAESVFNLIDLPPEEDLGTEKLSKVEGKLEFNHVSFSYSSAKTVLNSISFTILPGQTVALVGHSGSGKSTIANLIPRFYDLTQGEIYLDGINIKKLTLTNLRQHIALVTQHVTLFNDTLAKNIAYGQFDATLKQIERAVKLAHASEFIEKLPQGLETKIGEDGLLLSGGQRQRIAIARAILKNSPILVLDEATSALDTESERHIQAALDEVMRDRTTLVIAHRLSTIEKADKIIVIDDGKIVEQGTHRQLLNHNGQYAMLYKMQFSQETEALTDA
jgi:ATP-binding cassette, subfamily B, bacterial MsbA